MDAKKKLDLQIFAAEIRRAIHRQLIGFGFGHLGGSMSAADALAVLYGEFMNIDPKNPAMEDRDYFALSKAHAGPVLYATLALKGFFPMEELDRLNKNGTSLPSHCSRVNTPGVDLTGGSLGTGVSGAVGVALATKIIGGPNYAYAMVGDGEMDEGQVWEAILFAAAKKLDNFVLFIDYNKEQLDGRNDDICPLGDVAQKMKDFGFYTQDINGNDVEEIYNALVNAKANKGCPSAIVLNTVKGYGSKIAEDLRAKGMMVHGAMFPDKEVNAKEMARFDAVIEELKAERSAL